MEQTENLTQEQLRLVYQVKAGCGFYGLKFKSAKTVQEQDEIISNFINTLKGEKKW